MYIYYVGTTKNKLTSKQQEMNRILWGWKGVSGPE